MRIAYLVNQYPKISHTFVRREIAALEVHGVEVDRISIRACDEQLVDPADIGELGRTRALLYGSKLALLGELGRELFQRPRRLLHAGALAMRLARTGDRSVLHHVAYLAEACRLERWLRELGAEHVHVHFATNASIVAMLCAALDGPRFSFTLHGQEELDRALSLGEQVRRASFVVAVSEFGRRAIQQRARQEDRHKIQLVRCGLDPGLLEREPGPPPETPRLVCVARMRHEKGHAVLIEAAAGLAAAGQDFELVLVGDGELRSSIERAIEARGLSEKVRLTGWAAEDRVLEEIRAARALVVASLAEGLPIVIMEAFALGRPVVSTAVAGIPELVEDGVTGWLVPPGSAEGLRDGMKKALRADRRERESMGCEARRRVRMQHDASRNAGQLAQLFRRAAATV